MTGGGSEELSHKRENTSPPSPVCPSCQATFLESPNSKCFSCLRLVSQHAETLSDSHQSAFLERVCRQVCSAGTSEGHRDTRPEDITVTLPGKTEDQTVCYVFHQTPQKQLCTDGQSRQGQVQRSDGYWMTPQGRVMHTTFHAQDTATPNQYHVDVPQNSRLFSVGMRGFSRLLLAACAATGASYVARTPDDRSGEVCPRD